MALRKWTKNGVSRLTDSQIKAEIMARLGLDSKSAADNKTYKKKYDVQRLRTVNYSHQQMLETPVRINENWLRTLRNQQAGAPLTAHQAGILSTSSQNTLAYLRRIERGDRRIRDAGIINLENQFKDMLDKVTGYRDSYNNFIEGQRVTQNIVNKHGEVVQTLDITRGERPPKDLAKRGLLLEDPHIEYVDKDDITIKDAKDFLEGLADDLHEWQDERLESNRAVYGKPSSRKRKVVESP